MKLKEERMTHVQLKKLEILTRLNRKLVKYDLQSYIFYNEKFNDVVLEYCEGDNLFYLKIDENLSVMSMFIYYFNRDKERLKNNILKSLNEILEPNTVNFIIEDSEDFSI